MSTAIHAHFTRQTPKTHSEEANAIRWLLDNRRHEVSIDQAVRTLRIALSGDREAMKLLDQIAVESISERTSESTPQ